MENLKAFYDEFTETRNIFDLQALCKMYYIEILARDCNNTSCIVKYKGCKWYLSEDKIERSN